MSNVGQSRIGQIAIVCQDVARATAFYRDTLGLNFLFAAGPTLSFFDVAGTRLMLSNMERNDEGQEFGTSVLYYFVTDIEGTRRDLMAKGVRFLNEAHMIAQMPDHQLWLAEFRDSEGNAMALMEEKR